MAPSSLLCFDISTELAKPDHTIVYSVSDPLPPGTEVGNFVQSAKSDTGPVDFGQKKNIFQKKSPEPSAPVATFFANPARPVGGGGSSGAGKKQQPVIRLARKVGRKSVAGYFQVTGFF